MAGAEVTGLTGSPRGWRESRSGEGPALGWRVTQSKYLDKLLHVSPKELLVILGAGAGKAFLLEFSLCVLGPVVNRSWL